MIRTLVAVLGFGFVMHAHAAEGIDTEAFFASSFTGLEGETLAMEQYRGRPLIVKLLGALVRSVS